MDYLEPTYSFITRDLVPKYQLGLQVLAGILALWVFMKQMKKQRQPHISKNEEVDIIKRWNPEPLVRSVSMGFKAPPIIRNQAGKFIVVNGVNCLNFATHNYLGLAKDPRVEEAAVSTVKKYGVGSCGPRGFFGTLDVHLELEKKLAKFMNAEEAVVYSYGFSTIASAIAAYAKKRDIVFADEQINFSIQKGLDASRSVVRYFKHNDVQHLSELLAEQSKLDEKNPQKAKTTRKFLIVEGIYAKTGEMCPLEKLMPLKMKYKLRLFIDESVSFGTLGNKGKGVTDYYNIPISDVDLIMCEMERALASVGGFCVGSTYTVDHQRINGSGYCFSASLPPLLTVAAAEAVDMIDENPSRVHALNRICEYIDRKLKDSEIIMKHFTVSGTPSGPIKHLFPHNDRTIALLEDMAEHCVSNGVALAVPPYLDVDKPPVRKSIRLTVNALMSENDVTTCLTVLEKAITSVL